jgi:hypothetical protein
MPKILHQQCVGQYCRECIKRHNLEKKEKEEILLNLVDDIVAVVWKGIRVSVDEFDCDHDEISMNYDRHKILKQLQSVMELDV